MNNEIKIRTAEDFITNWRETELLALDTIMEWAKNEKKTFTNAEKKKVLEILVKHGTSNGVLWLVGYVLGVADNKKAIKRLYPAQSSGTLLY